MRQMRSAVALMSALLVMACQTASAVGAGRAVSPVQGSATFMTARNAVGIVSPSRAGVTREFSQQYSAAAVPGGRKTLLIVAVIAVVIVAAVLVAGGDGDGIGY